MIQESSVNAILGRRGTGKTTVLAHIGEIDQSLGKKIVCNFDVSYPHIYMDFSEIILLKSEDLQDCTLLLDELQIGAGGRDAFKYSNKQINKFITQLRKRNIMLYYTTQIFKFVDINIRRQTDFIMLIEKIDNQDHMIKIMVFDRNDYTDGISGSVIKVIEWDATDFFSRNVFNTNQIIDFGEEDED